MHLDAPDLWRHDPWLQGVGAQLTACPRPYALVTFDFFDTLVHRLTAHPDDVFVEVGRRLQDRNLFRTPLTPEEFYYVRRAADEQARKRSVAEGRGLEVRLRDIYAEMGRVVADPARAAELEWEVEEDLCFLNPSMASFIKHLRTLGYATALLSDTYYEASQLRSLLQRLGFNPALFDRIWTSCEHGCAKYDRGLYHRVLQASGLNGNQVLHVGDNPAADVQGASAAGIHPLEYHRRLGVHDVVFRTEAALRLPQRPSAGSLDSLRVLATRLGGCDPNDGFFEGAMAFGPALARFADWAVETYHKAGIRVVLALMREGELLGEMVRRAASARQIPLEVIPCYVSRKSTAVASLGEPSVDRLMELLTGGPLLAWQDVLEILGILEYSRQAPGLTPELLAQRVPSVEVLRELVVTLLRNPNLRGMVEERIRETHGLAYEYLHGLVGGEAQVGVLDLGWSGSIQKNMAAILAQGGHPARLVGCYLANTPRVGKLALQGHEAHGFLTQDWAFKSLLLEISITAMVGSTEGYVWGADGKVVPVLGPFQVTDAERRTKERLTEGILGFQDLWLRVLAPRLGRDMGRILADIDRQLYAVVLRLLHYPTQEDSRTLGLLEHDENYGVAYRQPLVDEAALRDFEVGGLEALQRSGTCYWPQGVLARQSPRLMHALALRWDTSAPLGHLGGRATHEGKALSFGQDERHFLDQLLASVDLGQVVFVSAGADGDLLWLNTWLQAHHREPSPTPWEGPREIPLAEPGKPSEATPREGLPRAVHIDASRPAGPALELVPGLCQTGGKLLGDAGVHRLRRLLRLGEPTLLLFSQDLPEGLILGTLRSLAPFLAPGSITGVCHGSSDPVQAFGTTTPRAAFLQWLGSGADALGFEAVDNLFENRTFVTSLSLALRNPPAATA